MRRTMLAVLAGAALLAGCGGKAAVHAATSAQAKQAEAEAQKVLNGCLKKGNLVTSSGRKAVVSCIAPPAQAPALEACVSGAASRDGFWTKKRRAQLSADVLKCVESVKR